MGLDVLDKVYKLTYNTIIMQNTLIQINQNEMGSGDETLSLILIKNYLKLINEERYVPQVIAFYNAGIKLVCEGSTVLEELKALEARGVKLMVCKTCLNHFNLSDKQVIGIAGTMMDIIEIQKVASKVITV